MRLVEGEVVEDSTRIASRHATRGMKIDQRTRCEDRDDASISKVVEWFRALALRSPFFSASSPLPILLAPPLDPRSPDRLSLSLSLLPTVHRSNRSLSEKYVRSNLDLNYSQFSLSHFQVYLRPRPGRASPGRGSNFHLESFEVTRA